MSKILVKKSTPQVGMNVGSGGPGVSFLLGGDKMMNPKQLENAGFGKIGSDSHNFALANQERGRMLRYGLAGLGAFNSAYNQTSSGQPGVLGAVGSGAMQGYYGSQGLEDFAARAGKRFGGRNLSTGAPVNTTATVPAPPMSRRIAPPTQHVPYVQPANFTVLEEDEEENEASNNGVGVTTPFDAIVEQYGNGSNNAGRQMYNTMERKYGQ